MFFYFFYFYNYLPRVYFLLIQLHVTDANYSWNSMFILYEWLQWSFIDTDIIENALREVSAHI